MLKMGNLGHYCLDNALVPYDGRKVASRDDATLNNIIKVIYSAEPHEIVDFVNAFPKLTKQN